MRVRLGKAPLSFQRIFVGFFGKDNMGKKRTSDKHLLEALIRAYTARAKLFHEALAASQIDLLITEIDGIAVASLSWNLAALDISASAFKRVKAAKGKPHQVFAHPEILSNRPHLVAYYRNLATLSQKGVAQILFPTS